MHAERLLRSWYPRAFSPPLARLNLVLSLRTCGPDLCRRRCSCLSLLPRDPFLLLSLPRPRCLHCSHVRSLAAPQTATVEWFVKSTIHWLISAPSLSSLFSLRAPSLPPKPNPSYCVVVHVVDHTLFSSLRPRCIDCSHCALSLPPNPYPATVRWFVRSTIPRRRPPLSYRPCPSSPGRP